MTSVSFYGKLLDVTRNTLAMSAETHQAPPAVVADPRLANRGGQPVYDVDPTTGVSPVDYAPVHERTATAGRANPRAERGAHHGAAADAAEVPTQVTHPEEPRRLPESHMARLYRDATSGSDANYARYAESLQRLAPAQRDQYLAYSQARNAQLAAKREAAEQAATSGSALRGALANGGPAEQQSNGSHGTEQGREAQIPLSDTDRAYFHGLIDSGKRDQFEQEYHQLPLHQQAQLNRDLHARHLAEQAQAARALPQAPARTQETPRSHRQELHDPGYVTVVNPITNQQEVFRTGDFVGDYSQHPMTWSLGMYAALPQSVRSGIYERPAAEQQAFHDGEFALRQMQASGHLVDGSLGVTSTYGLAPENITPDLLEGVSDGEILALIETGNADRLASFNEASRNRVAERAISLLSTGHHNIPLSNEQAAAVFNNARRPGLFGRAARRLRGLLSGRNGEDRNTPEDEARLAAHLASTAQALNPENAPILTTLRPGELPPHKRGRLINANVETGVGMASPSRIEVAMPAENPEAGPQPKLPWKLRAAELASHFVEDLTTHGYVGLGWLMNKLSRDPRNAAEELQPDSRPLSKAKVFAAVGMIAAAYFGTRFGLAHLGAEEVHHGGGGVNPGDHLDQAGSGNSTAETTDITPEEHKGPSLIDDHNTEAPADTDVDTKKEKPVETAPKPPTPIEQQAAQQEAVDMGQPGSQSVTLWDAEKRYAEKLGFPRLSTPEANEVTRSLLDKNHIDWAKARDVRVDGARAFYDGRMLIQLTPQEVQAAIDKAHAPLLPR